MTYGYYPGCSLDSMSVEYDVSLRNVFDRLQIKLEQIPDWICCGTLAAPSTSRLLGLATPLWNVARATHAGFETVITPCSACLYHSKSALHQLRQDPSLVPQIESILDLPLANPSHFIHPIELLDRPEFAEKIKNAVVNDLSQLQVVCYYGCLMTRPPRVMQFDVADYPQSMDRILQTAGIQTLDWNSKTDCCGAIFSMIDTNVVLDLCRKILNNARSVGAQAIVVGCPMCQINLDSRQADIQARFGDKFDLPVLYFSQLLGLAMDIPNDGLGLWRHVVEPSQIMQCVKSRNVGQISKFVQHEESRT